MSEKLQDLKKEADELGITYSANIGEVKLQEKIEAFYEGQETQSAELLKVVEELAQEDPAPVAKAKTATSFRAMAKQMEAEARKTRVIIITDNDKRENGDTTTCTATCENEFFSLGTIILPLNEKVEVRQGHINSLKECKIPHHVRDPNDPSVSATVQRHRYSIAYED